MKQSDLIKFDDNHVWLMPLWYVWIGLRNLFTKKINVVNKKLNSHRAHSNSLINSNGNKSFQLKRICSYVILLGLDRMVFGPNELTSMHIDHITGIQSRPDAKFQTNKLAWMTIHFCCGLVKLGETWWSDLCMIVILYACLS